MSCRYFFFFQAEDGIRDKLVTGVQTCALPICKVLVPAFEFIHKLTAARLAADVAGVPIVIVARTDADSAKLLTSDFDERDKPFCTGERTEDGFFRIRSGLNLAIARALDYAPLADVIWCETSTPDLKYARQFAEGVKEVYPEKLLAYN